MTVAEKVRTLVREFWHATGDMEYADRCGYPVDVTKAVVRRRAAIKGLMDLGWFRNHERMPTVDEVENSC